MTWSYGGDPANSVVDRIRFLSGDTNTLEQWVTNEEIMYLYSLWGTNEYQAAAATCEAIASKIALKADYSRSVGDLSISTQYGAQAATMMKRANDLFAHASRIPAPAPRFYTDNSGDVFGPTHFRMDMDENLGRTEYNKRTVD
jgi:hypothetical protein